MPLKPEIFQDILADYGFAGEILDIHYYIDDRNDQYDYAKYIARVTATEGTDLVVKLVHEFGLNSSQMRPAVIEAQCRFATHLRQRGIPTPRRHQNDGGGYCTIRTLEDGLTLAVTVEDWCGEELKAIDLPLAERAGALMARTHQLALEVNYRIGAPTLFSAAEKNGVNCFPRFEKLCRTPGVDQALAAQISTLYHQKMERLQTIWPALPVCAVQGDFSINNLCWDGEKLTLFDFNNAGDVPPVSDAILEGLLTAYEMDLAPGLTDGDRPALFRSFLEGYQSVRPFTDVEQTAAREIYLLYDSLWFTKLVYQEGSLEKLLKAGDLAAANLLLSRFYADLTRPAETLFA